MSGFRLGVIGTGIVAALHLEAARAVPGVRVTAVCDIHEAAAVQAAAGTGATAYTDHRRMLTREPLDGVVITAPHALHAGMTLDAAAAGVPVLVEKPMATTVADCTAMIEACAAAGVVLAVGHVVRFDPAAHRVARLLRSGDLGDVLAIHHHRTAHYQRGSRPGWFFDPAMAGGGIVMNVGIHGLDRIQWAGDGTAESATARVWHRDGHAVETDAMGSVTLSSGVAAGFLLTSAAGRFHDETTVVCSRGALRWSSTDGTWASRDGAPETQVMAPGGGTGEAFTAQLADFVAACRGHRPPEVGGDYGRSVVATVLAIYASAASGRPASLCRS
ncbi:Gfo/Idh/MocA family oxidoreductase [Dactylosporangium sp. NPDC006015]|uniref:Gfo/Idh/MocA family protein n=1 Tax=Dactylosporangium sp. NPDC006015 TaxID=3154576 RepID=UPI0033B92697